MGHEMIEIIPLTNLLLMLIPTVFVLIIYIKWQLDAKEASYSIARMLIQLTMIGYLLGFILNAESGWVVFGTLSIMLFASAWIALRTVKKVRTQLLGLALVSILVGSGSVLLFIMLAVLNLDPWYDSRYMIPLGGMILANSMNCISLSMDRLLPELENGLSYEAARNKAFQAALIPIINSLFAVGVVTLPGMMTGQILSGVDPLIAIRYQIVVMCMIFSSAGITTACFLFLSKRKINHLQN